jgi:hypothetical protein
MRADSEGKIKFEAQFLYKNLFKMLFRTGLWSHRVRIIGIFSIDFLTARNVNAKSGEERLLITCGLNEFTVFRIRLTDRITLSGR